MSAQPTIYDIAERAGTSIATVSRVMNGRSGVRSQTEQRVRAVLDELDFRPRLKAVTNNRILVLIINNATAMSSAYSTAVLAGVTQEAFANGLTVSLRPLVQRLSNPGELRQLCREEAASGVLMIATPHAAEIARQLCIEPMPSVVAGCSMDVQTRATVWPDDRESAQKATEYLLSLGHRRIGFLSFDHVDHGHRLRFEGFTKAMQNADSKPTIVGPVQSSDISLDAGRSAARQLLQSTPSPTAVIVTNEGLAKGVLEETREMGLRIPDDLSLLVYESADRLRWVDPPITVMATPAHQMGQKAVQSLVTQLLDQTQNAGQLTQGDCQPTAVVPHTLVIRRSTAPPPKAAK